jgi:hypothetical protein
MKISAALLIGAVVLLVLSGAGTTGKTSSGMTHFTGIPESASVVSGYGGGGSGQWLNLSDNEKVSLHVQYEFYDAHQQVNFTVIDQLYLSGTFGADISVVGAGLPKEWFNYSWTGTGITIITGYHNFSVIPPSAGDLLWNMTIGGPSPAQGSRTSSISPDPMANFTLTADRTNVFRNQSVSMKVVSKISGGTPPYTQTWEENGRPIIIMPETNFTSYDPAFRTPGNYTFCVVLNDSANFEIIGNNVTIHVESPPQVLFIHPAVLIANETYPIQLDINSSLAFNQTAIMPDGSHHTGKNLSFSYKFNNSGLNVITSEVYWNGSRIESLNLSVYVEPVSLVLYPEVLPESGTVYFNLSADSNLPVTGANVSVKGIPGTVTQFWQSRLIQLGLVSSYGQQYNLSAAMNEFLFTAGSYYANFTATDSQGITARESIRFIVNFSFAYVSISFSENVTNGLLKLVASTTSNYTVEWAMLQLSGPSGVTEYNMSLSEFNASTHTWTWSQTIDVYSLGGGTYTALISAENSRNFTNYSSFSFGVTPPSQPYAFSFLSVVDAFGGPTNFVVAVSAIVGIIGVLAAVFSRGSETVVIGGQPYRSKPGRPLVRLKRGKK